MSVRFNEDYTRMASDEHAAFGIACYEGEAVDGMFEGYVVANVGTPEDADRWVDVGELPAKCIRPYSRDSWIAPWGANA